MTMKPEYAVIYGPPRSLRGKLKNLIRRLIGDPPQSEVYWKGPVHDAIPTGPGLTVVYTSSGTLEID